MRAIISFVLGGILLVAGYFWNQSLDFSVLSMLAALVIAIGGALIVTGIAQLLDSHSPTSRKL